jgi:Protein kinase domain/Ankyrin repeats (many copies)
MSSRLIPSKDGRGTSGYRAPELLGGTCEFNARSDIWALGCIMYELESGRRVFAHDWATSTFYDKTPVPELPLQLSYSDQFWEFEIRHCLTDLLSKKVSDRPRAAYLLRRLSTLSVLIDIDEVRPSLHWKFLVGDKRGSTARQWRILVEAIFVLAEDYFLEGPDHERRQILKEIVSRIVQLRFHGSTFSPSTGDELSFWHETGPVMARVLDRLILRREFEDASFFYSAPFVEIRRDTSRMKGLVVSARIGDVVGILVALKLGEDVNGTNYFLGRSALHIAVDQGHATVAEILLLHGADWNIRDTNGETPWDWAKKKGQKEMVETISRFKDAKQGYFSRRTAETNGITPSFQNSLD